MHRWIAPVLAAAVVSAVALIAVTPLLPVPLAAIVYAAGSLICHQLPDRSFHLHSFQLPVCARCLGLYGGAAIGSVIGLTAWSRRVLRAGQRTTRHWRWTAAAALPTAMTFVLEWGFGWRISNEVRAIAGVPLGLAVASVVVSAVATLHYDECTPPRPIGHGQPPAANI